MPRCLRRRCVARSMPFPAACRAERFARTALCRGGASAFRRGAPGGLGTSQSAVRRGIVGPAARPRPLAVLTKKTHPAGPQKSKINPQNHKKPHRPGRSILRTPGSLFAQKSLSRGKNPLDKRLFRHYTESVSQNGLMRLKRFSIFPFAQSKTQSLLKMTNPAAVRRPRLVFRDDFALFTATVQIKKVRSG